MGFGGAALKFGSTALYALEFCCAAIILGIYSYFLSVEADRDVNIPVWQQAVTGLAGATVLYTIFAVLLTCFLGGKVRTFLASSTSNFTKHICRKSSLSSAYSLISFAAAP
jgi:biotin transporter BioY